MGADGWCEVCGGWRWEQMGGVRCEVCGVWRWEQMGGVRCVVGGDGSRWVV